MKKKLNLLTAVALIVSGVFVLMGHKQDKPNYFDCEHYDYYSFDPNQLEKQLFIDDLYDSLYILNQVDSTSPSLSRMLFLNKMYLGVPYFLPNRKHCLIADSIQNYFEENGGFRAENIYFNSLDLSEALGLLVNDLCFLGTVIDQKDYKGATGSCYRYPTSYIVRVDEIVKSVVPKLEVGDLVFWLRPCMDTREIVALEEFPQVIALHFFNVLIERMSSKSLMCQVVIIIGRFGRTK